MSNIQTVVEVKNLTKKFGPAKAKSAAVDNISFSIKEGEIVGFLGANGAGKTTTMRMMLSLITPTAGQINIFGKDISLHREEILKKVNFTFVDSHFGARLTVYETLIFFSKLYEVSDTENKISHLMERFEIIHLKDKRARELSSGELSRLCLCKAFINSPEILFLDEPTASLDPDMADKTRKLIKEMQSNNKITIIYTSHNMREVEEMCGRIIFLHKGKIIISGTPLEITQNILQVSAKEPSLREVFIKISRGEGYELE